MYELTFTYKYGFILKRYKGPEAFEKMNADIEFYKSNFAGGSAQYLYYSKED